MGPVAVVGRVISRGATRKDADRSEGDRSAWGRGGSTTDRRPEEESAGDRSSKGVSGGISVGSERLPRDAAVRRPERVGGVGSSTVEPSRRVR